MPQWWLDICMTVIFKVRTGLSGHIGAFEILSLYHSKIFTKEVFNLKDDYWVKSLDGIAGSKPCFW